MKIRSGFVSNSSTASFVVKTEPDFTDKLFKDRKVPTLSPEKIKLLKKCGFKYTNVDNPFMRALYVDYMGGDDKRTARTQRKKTPFLCYWVDCNESGILQFLVSQDIPFKAAVHYGDELYSYEQGDKHIYILYNFGIEYTNQPKNIIREMKDDKEWRKFVPYERITVKKFLKGYDKEEALLEMGIKSDK